MLHFWEVISRVTSELGNRARSIKYVTVTTSASSLVALDSKGNPLGNSILVSETWARNEASLVEHTVEFQTVQTETGGKCTPDLMLPKIMWLAKDEPDNFKQASHFVNVGDYLVAQITGRYVTDWNNAMKFHFLMSQRDYPR